MRKPADVIIEQRLHPNPGPSHAQHSEVKRRRSTDERNEQQSTDKKITDGITPGYYERYKKQRNTEYLSGNQKRGGQRENKETQDNFLRPETPLSHLKIKVEKNTTIYENNTPQNNVAGVGWSFPIDDSAMPKHTPVCGTEDHLQTGKAYENILLTRKKR